MPKKMRPRKKATAATSADGGDGGARRMRSRSGRLFKNIIIILFMHR